MSVYEGPSGARAVEWYPPGEQAAAFFRSTSFVVGIMGPIGSGKSVTCAQKLFRIAQCQPVSPVDGRRHSRFAVIRNTYPELKTTTIKTWHDWFPASLGHWRDEGPPTHLIVTKEFHIEVMFVALDRPEDVRKLLSMELTAAWMNEAREIPKAILDGLTGRVGRYPSIRHGGCINPQIVMDTNAPDTDHWWYRLAEEETPPGWEFFRQPGGLTDGAENTHGLSGIPGGRLGYYTRAAQGKDEQWVKVYVHGEYGFVMDGKPVYPEYVDSVHCKAVELDRRCDLLIGMDFGLTPAAILGQRLPGGRIIWRREWVTEDMGVRRFGEIVAADLRPYRESGYKIGAITGDPAGEARDHDERTAFAILIAVGLDAKPASTNEYSIRREAVAKPLSTLIDGAPGLLIHPECQRTRKGMAGGYHYRRVQVRGDERYHDKPDKGPLSHVCEAGQYLNLGAGEGKSVVRREPAHATRRPATALSDYRVLG